MKPEAVARKILDENIHMVVATASKKGEPWVSPVYYSFDRKYNFYWISARNSFHSGLIKKNPKVSIVVFDSMEQNNINAVYMTGKAHEATFGELKHAVTVIYQRKMKTHNKLKIRNYMDFRGASPRRVYVFVPEKVWVLKPPQKLKGHKIDFRIKVKL